MKQCPHCHATIEENARFCIYCMTNFEAKKPIPGPKPHQKGPAFVVSALSLTVVATVVTAAVGIGMLAKAFPEMPPDGEQNPSGNVMASASENTEKTGFFSASDGETDATIPDPSAEHDPNVSTGNLFTNTESNTATENSHPTDSQTTPSVRPTQSTDSHTSSSSQPPKNSNTQTTSSSRPTQSTGTQTSPGNPYPPEPEPEADIAYTFDEKTGTLTLSGKGAMPDYPQEMGGPWKKYEYEVKKVIVSEGITSVGEFAFSNFAYLVELLLPKSLSSINYGAFMGCRSLTGCDFPDRLKTIESYAFSGCSFINLHLPAGVTEIQDYAFSNYRFASGFEKITVASGNPYYHAKGNCLIETKTKTMILGCKNSIIPADGSVTAIFTYAFQYCNGLTKITVPDAVTCLENQVFYGCEDLTEVTLPKDLKRIEYATFYDCEKLTRITLPQGLLAIGESAFFGCKNLTEITLPSSLSAIEKTAFGNCVNLKTVYNESALTVTKGSSKHGYVAYYAENVYN